MTSPSPTTIPRVHEQLAGETVPGELAARGELAPAPLVPVRRTMVTAGISTAAFIALSTTPYVNETLTVQGGSGMVLLASELFWLSAAAMGASFAMLLQAGGYAGRGDERSWWVQLAVGVMAGFILVALLPVSGLVAGVSQPTIAVLGAFLASVAFRFLPGARTRPGHERDQATTER
jgi:hypothetical protein